MATHSPTETVLIKRMKSHFQPMSVVKTGISAELKPLNDIKAVMFDIYGTLIISGSGDIGLSINQHREQAFRSALLAAGIGNKFDRYNITGSDYFIREIEKNHQKKREIGIDFPEVDIREIWETVLNVLSEKSLIDPVRDENQHFIVAVEYECRMNPTWPMPGMREILNYLDKKEFITGIISNAQFFTPLLIKAHTGRTLNELGFEPELCYFSYEYDAGKPSIKLFELAKSALLTKYHIEPPQVLYIGNDMLNDVMPATKCGFRTALFAGEKRSLRLREQDSSVEEYKPDITLTTLKQLGKCLTLNT